MLRHFYEIWCIKCTKNVRWIWTTSNIFFFSLFAKLVVSLIEVIIWWILWLTVQWRNFKWWWHLQIEFRAIKLHVFFEEKIPVHFFKSINRTIDLNKKRYFGRWNFLNLCVNGWCLESDSLGLPHYNIICYAIGRRWT